MSVCLLANGIFKRHIILSPVAVLPLPYFFTLSHKRQKIIERKIVLIFSATFVYNVCLSKNTSDGFGGLVVSMLASGSRVRGFEF
jgi:hypothetical protein